MGASLTMIDCHYGLLARDGREHAIRLLEELSAGERPRWTLVDAAWTPSSAAAVSEDNGNASSFDRSESAWQQPPRDWTSGRRSHSFSRTEFSARTPSNGFLPLATARMKKNHGRRRISS
jgi:hypothetical protein